MKVLCETFGKGSGWVEVFKQAKLILENETDKLKAYLKRFLYLERNGKTSSFKQHKSYIQ